MKIMADWHGARAAARHGELGPAAAARAVDGSGALADYFHARCLAEAGVALDEAIALLRPLSEGRRRNLLAAQTLALALARLDEPGAAREAATIWRREGLPHSADLLGQVALTLEEQARPWPADSPAMELGWPPSLPAREEFLHPPAPPLALTSADQPASPDNPEPPGRANLTQADATIQPWWGRRWRLGRVVDRMENFLAHDRALDALRLGTDALQAGDPIPELHAMCGIVADAAGDAVRARAHLATALAMEEGLLLARTHLGRAYWRSGWTDAAMAIWRSLPVEGPYDHGRHYHLALGHQTLGDRPAAALAIEIALGDFFFDMRHYYISHALRRWLRLKAPGESAAG